jgi:hypothetical protein
LGRKGDKNHIWTNQGRVKQEGKKSSKMVDGVVDIPWLRRQNFVLVHIIVAGVSPSRQLDHLRLAFRGDLLDPVADDVVDSSTGLSSCGTSRSLPFLERIGPSASATASAASILPTLTASRISFALAAGPNRTSPFLSAEGPTAVTRLRVRTKGRAGGAVPKAVVGRLGEVLIGCLGDEATLVLELEEATAVEEEAAVVKRRRATRGA